MLGAILEQFLTLQNGQKERSLSLAWQPDILHGIADPMEGQVPPCAFLPLESNKQQV